MPYPAFVLTSLIVAVLTASAVLASRSRSAAVAAAFAGATALLFLHGYGLFRLFADDAYITFRYSRNLADGVGPTWNAGTPVEGYTNFSWMLVLAGFSKVGADLVVTSQVLAGIAILATFVAVYVLWRRWAEDDPDSGVGQPMVLAAALMGLAVTSAVPYWGFSGMETPLFMALITWGAVLVMLEQRRDAAVPWSAVVFAAAAMTRPEGLIAVAVSGLFVVSSVLDPARRSIALRRAVMWGALFAAVYVPYFAWRFTYYDHLLPNTFYAKVEPNREVFNRGADYVWTYGTRYLLPAFFLGMTLLLTRPALKRDAAYILALAGAMLAGIVLEGADAFPQGRLIAPLLPLIYVSGLAGFAFMLKQLPLTGRQPALIAIAALGIGALALLYSSQEGLVSLRREEDARQERVTLSHWLNDYTPEDFTIAAFAVGAIGYETRRDVLDMLGLNDTTIAHTDVPNVGLGIGGHEKYNIDYVLETVRPEIIVINDAEGHSWNETDLRAFLAIGSRVPARDLLFADPRLWDRYDVRSVQIDGKWYNFLQRVDTKDELQAPGLQ